MEEVDIFLPTRRIVTVLHSKVCKIEQLSTLWVSFMKKYSFFINTLYKNLYRGSDGTPLINFG